MATMTIHQRWMAQCIIIGFLSYVSVNSRWRWQSMTEPCFRQERSWAFLHIRQVWEWHMNIIPLASASDQRSLHLYFYSNSEKMRRIIYLFFDETFFQQTTPLRVITLHFVLNLSHDLHSSIIYTGIRCKMKLWHLTNRTYLENNGLFS